MRQVERINCQCDHSAVENVCRGTRIRFASRRLVDANVLKYTWVEMILPFHPSANSIVRYTALERMMLVMKRLGYTVVLPNKKADSAKDQSTDHHLHPSIHQFYGSFFGRLANGFIQKEPQEELRCANDVDYKRD